MKIKNNPIININETPSEMRSKANKWLERIGVAKSDIEYDYNRSEGWAKVSFVLNNKVYVFKSKKQKDYKTNLKAIEIFLHNRVINIERGIEQMEKAFEGYLQLENKPIFKNPYLNMDEKEIKSLMKIYHPDMPNGNRNKFEQLQFALNNLRGILKNEE